MVIGNVTAAKPHAVGALPISQPHLSGPPRPLVVTLETFQGPLDLLLLQVRNHELDITTIRLAQITRHYLEMLGIAERVDLDVAGEFLVLTATLLYIKSRSLLPPAEAAPDAEEQDDPRAEFAHHMLQYQQFKEAAEAFSQLRAERQLVYTRPMADPDRKSVV